MVSPACHCPVPPLECKPIETTARHNPTQPTANQGILSSFFFKFADTILKKYSSTIATIFTAIMSWALFSHPLTANFALGVSIVFVSMHQFFSFGDKKGGPPAALDAAGGAAGAAAGANGSANGGGWRESNMIASPSMEHFRVQPEPAAAASGGTLASLVEDAEGGRGGGGGGGGVSSRTPLLPR
jgi:hypothetical protein